MQRHEYADGWESPIIEDWTDDYEPNQETAAYEDASEEIAALKEKLQESQKHAEGLEQKWIAAIQKGSKLQLELGKLYCTQKNETKTRTAEIDGLKRKLKDSENKVRELQKGSNWKTISDETAELKNQLQQSEKKVKELQEKWKSASDEAVQSHFQLERLQKEFDKNKTNSEKTINGLKKVLEGLQKQMKNKKEISEKTIHGLKKQLAQACGECSKDKGQIQQIHEAQRQLQEQATQHRQEREQFLSEMDELKSQLATQEDLHASHLQFLKEEREEKASMEAQLQEQLHEAQSQLEEQATQHRQEREQFLSEMDELKSQLILELDEPETQNITVPETPKKKKKKRSWLSRLVTRTETKLK